MSQPHFDQVWGWNSHFPKLGIWSPPGLPECLEFDNKGKNTSPWGVLSVIGKVLKCKCPKWPRIGHSDICSPSYGQKKGRESNWQFDSRPLKVGNRPAPDVHWGSATRRWKAFKEGYKFGSKLVRSEVGARSYDVPKSRESKTETISGLHFGSPGTNNHLGVGAVE